MEGNLKRSALVFEAMMSRRLTDDDPDAAPIRITHERYAQIEDAVLELYRRADARIMPLEVFEIATAIGYAPIPYRLVGPVLYPAFMKTSKDGFSTWSMGDKWAIYYNDRRPILRQRFTLAHELGHVMLNHREHSDLAEKEANHFAAAALCPLPLLSLYKIQDVESIGRIFKVSEECAENRFRDFIRWTNLEEWKRNRRFGKEVCERFQLLEPFQPTLFDLGASS